jgi:hypothetical protein
MEIIEEEGIIWGNVEIHEVPMDSIHSHAVTWTDPNHRIEALKIVQQLMVDYHTFGNVVELLEEVPDAEMSRKQSLNVMFTYADHIVNYISKGEKIPLIGTIAI